MNKTIRLQRYASRTEVLSGAVVVAMLVSALIGVQSASAAISTQLELGDRGSEVTELQAFLSRDVNLYPSGLVTGYFGQLTKAGVERFQAAHGIVSSGTPATTGYGRVGPRTMAAINAQLAGGGNPSGDVSAPIIRSTNVSVDNDGASITWTASEVSMGKVYYSTSPIRISNVFDATGISSGEPIVSGTLAQYDGIARVTHTVNIDNLTPNTTYYYLIVVFDASKNANFTLPALFHTS